MKKTIKGIISLTIGMLVVGTTFTGCNILNKEKKVADVYSKSITEKEYKTFFKITALNLQNQTQKPIWDQVQNGKKLTDEVQTYSLNYLISEKILSVKADDAKTKLTDKEQKTVDKDYKTAKTNLNKQYSTEIAAILKKVDLKKEDFYDQMKSFINEDGVIKKYTEKLYKNYNPKITDAEIKQATEQAKTQGTYEKVKAKHILIDITKHSDAQAKAKAEDILKQIKAGAKFEDLAKKYSEDPGSATNGGELGYFSKGQMVAEFEKAAFSLKKGEVSGLVKTKYGYHIIKVEDHQVLTQKQIKDTVKSTKFNDYFQKLLTKWKKAAKIKKYDTKIKIAGETTKKTEKTNKK